MAVVVAVAAATVAPVPDPGQLLGPYSLLIFLDIIRVSIASLHTRASNPRGRGLDWYDPTGQGEASPRFSPHFS